MRNVINRFKEPSTWAGLSVLLGLFGVQIAPEVLTSVVQIGAGVAGVAAVLVPEGAAA